MTIDDTGENNMVMCHVSKLPIQYAVLLYSFIIKYYNLPSIQYGMINKYH